MLKVKRIEAKSQAVVGEPLLVVRHRGGRVEALGGRVVFVDEEQLLRKGAQFYQVDYGYGTDTFPKLYPAVLALWFAHLNGERAYLYALDREGTPVALFHLGGEG